MDEAWSLVREFLNYPLFKLNQNEITLGVLVMFVVVVLSFFLFNKLLIKRWLSSTLVKFKIDRGTSYTLTRIAYYILNLVGIMVAFQFVGVDLSSLVVLFGFLSVGIGFGLQNLTSNFISGLIILLERPIRVGDRITVGDKEGDVTEINIRSTTVRTLNNISVIVPNSEFISSRVINWSHNDSKVRLEVEIGVSYNSDLETVLKTLKKVAAENEEVLDDPTPNVLFLNFGDSSWNLKLQAWIRNPQRHPQVRSDINCAIVHAFREENIEIPFPQRDVHLIPSSSAESELNIGPQDNP